MAADNKNKTLSLSRSVGSGKVQQTVGRGRTKTITVEVKKTRSFSRNDPKFSTQDSSRPRTDSGLTEEERRARLQALEKATGEAQRSRGLPPPVRQDRKPSLPPEEAVTESEAPRAKEAGAKHVSKHAEPKKSPEREATDEEKNAQRTKFREDKRGKAKLTITNIFEHEQAEERMRSLASVKRARQKAKRKDGSDLLGESKNQIKEVVLPETITVQELSNRMAVRLQEVIRELMKLGEMKNANDTLDADTAELVIQEFGHKVKRVTEADVEDKLLQAESTEEDMRPRPPVVTIMGHVDHGKTSLLDALRQTHVTEGEAGGITQHIGAYQIEKNGQKITFLDTPGHEAFTAMRKRGATVTDIVVLVVAADDGVMPQTIEAINHAKAAQVPIIVAINKVDKPEADPSRVKNELLSHELVAEEFGGDVQTVNVSAKTKQGLDNLIDTILLVAEMQNLSAATNRHAEGAVIEARIEKGRGVVATLLVQRGTLRQGDIVIAGTGFGRAKVIVDDRGTALKEAGPSTPVEILGLSDAPKAGDRFAIAENEKIARDVVDYRLKLKRDLKATEVGHAAVTDINQLFKASRDGSKELTVLIKGDVQGSVEAIIGSLEKLNNEEVSIKVVHSGAGGISESDVQLAAAVGAIIIAFNVRGDGKVRELAQKEGIDIKYYSIIYNLIDDMKDLVGGMMAPVKREQFLGNAEIQQVFKVTKAGKVAGCIVREGVVKRGAGVRLVRDNVVIHEGKLKTLKRFKDDASEVKEGLECGMAFENYDDIKEGDFIEAFEIIEEQQKI